MHPGQAAAGGGGGNEIPALIGCLADRDLGDMDLSAREGTSREGSQLALEDAGVDDREDASLLGPVRLWQICFETDHKPLVAHMCHSNGFPVPADLQRGAVLGLSLPL
jgi:hypothetical protein